MRWTSFVGSRDFDGHYEKHLCEIILNLDKSFRKCHLKTFLFSFSDNFVQRSRTICAILVDNISGNIPVKLFLIRASDSGDVILRQSLYMAALDKFQYLDHGLYFCCILVCTYGLTRRS